MVALVARGAPPSLAVPVVAGVALAPAPLVATVHINKRLHDERQRAEERQAALRRLARGTVADPRHRDGEHESARAPRGRPARRPPARSSSTAGPAGRAICSPRRWR